MSRGKKKPWETNPQAESAKAKKKELEKIGRVKSDPFGKGVFIDEAVKLNIEEFAKFTWKDVTTTPEGAEFGFKPGGIYQYSGTGYVQGVDPKIAQYLARAGVSLDVIADYRRRAMQQGEALHCRFPGLDMTFTFEPNGNILVEEGAETRAKEVEPKKPTDDWADNWAKKQGGQDGVESLKSV